MARLSVLLLIIIIPGILIFTAAYPLHFENQAHPTSLPPLKISEHGETYFFVKGLLHLQESVVDDKSKKTITNHSLLFISQTLREKPRGVVVSFTDGQILFLTFFSKHAKFPDNILFPDLFYRYFSHNSLRHILLQKGVGYLPCPEAVFQFSPPKIDDVCVPLMPAITVAIVHGIWRIHF